MPTQKQIDANRLNARKSTGPRSPEGKARSSMNALKSGIHAESHVIRGEYQAGLEALTAEYFDRFHPATPEQRMLVDTLVDCDWLLRRFRKIEAQLWEQGAQDANPPLFDTALAQAFRQNCDQFSRLQRRIDTTHRNYRIALQELRRLQAEDNPADLPTEPEPSLRNQPDTVTNGFVSPTGDQPSIDPPPPLPRTLLNSDRSPR